MTPTAMRTGSRFGIGILMALLLPAVLVAPAGAHSSKVNFGIDAIGITSATRITLGRVVVKGMVTCSKTTGGIGVNARVRQVAGRTTTIRGGGNTTIRCVAGTKVPYSITVTPRSGKFVGGNALVSASAYKETWSYNEVTDEEHYHWDGASIERDMKLSR